MNYAAARERSDGQGWHFTVKNDGRIWPHECCLDPGPPATEEDVRAYGYRLGEPTLGDAHAAHATQAEAEECLHQWRLRQAEAWEESAFHDWTGCSVCDEPTKKAARFRDVGGPEYVSLCDEHLTTDQVIAHVNARRRTTVIYS